MFTILKTVGGRPVINVEMDVMTAIAVRTSLFADTKQYTYDEKSCPQG